MFTITKRMEIAGAHKLDLTYASPCARLHGHNWIIEVEVSAERLDDDGMVIDFALIRKLIKDEMDHQNLNEVFPFNPTAENIAKWIADKLTGWIWENEEIKGSQKVTKVTVQESEGNKVCYIP